MKITAYVPCHNNQSTVAQVLSALKRQTRPADELLFINERCTDQSPQIAAEHGFRVLENPGKAGLASARNCALTHATGDILIGLDADVVVAENYLAELETQFLLAPEVTAIGGRLDEKFTDTPADLWRAMHMPQHHGTKEQINPPLLTGATMACRVQPIKNLGGWNERYMTNFEDVDLCTRMRAAGLNLLYAPACQAWHLRRDTFDSVLKTFWNWNYFGYEDRLANTANWVSDRLQYIWRTYRVFRVLDLDQPTLRPITFMLPWSWMMRDLFILRQSAGDIGNIRNGLADSLVEIARRYGMRRGLAMQFVDWLTKLGNTLEQGNRSPHPLAGALMNAIQYAALESIPDGTYWQMPGI